MSLDFSLDRTETVLSVNITHNVGKMWREAGCYDALYNSEGLKASDILPMLCLAERRMVNNPSFYQKLEPENGWGNYSGALDFLRDVMKGCSQNPDAIIRISK